METGKLYICGTPIGNLDDITFRVIKTLKTVDCIYAEDTRRSIKLLNYFDIQNRLKSYHEHNRKKAGNQMINQLKSGKNLALISDAGMPGISDPGEYIVKLCIDEKIDIVVIPGPTAFVSALVQSGFDTNKFSFEGFLDRKKSKREEHLESIKSDSRTLIFYESPHRLKKTLKSLLKVLGNRKISISRELTKKYEETLRFSLEEALEYYQTNESRGEFVLIVEGAIEEVKAEVFDLSIEEHIIQLMDEGVRKKKAIKEVAKIRGLKKNEVYKKSFNIRPKKE